MVSSVKPSPWFAPFLSVTSINSVVSCCSTLSTLPSLWISSEASALASVATGLSGTKALRFMSADRGADDIGGYAGGERCAVPVPFCLPDRTCLPLIF